MTLEELKSWETDGTEKEFSVAEIKELVVSIERAEKFLGNALFDSFVEIYNKPSLNNQSKILFTYEKFISTAKKIVEEFPYLYSGICNNSTELSKYIYSIIIGKPKNHFTFFKRNLMVLALFILYKFIESLFYGNYMIMVNCIAGELLDVLLLLIPYAGIPLSIFWSSVGAYADIRAVSYLLQNGFYSYGFGVFPSSSATFVYACIDIVLIILFIWLFKREYNHKITAESTAIDKIKIYGKYFLIFALVSIITVGFFLTGYYKMFFGV